MAKKYIKKVTLDDMSTYYIYDAEAPRITDLNNYVPITGGTITGNLTVDQKICAGELQVLDIRYIQSDDYTNVLIQQADGTIMKRSIDSLLGDIGGCSFKMNDATGVLSFQQGKFVDPI